MEEESKFQPVMECPAHYLLRDDESNEIAKGSSVIQLDQEKVIVNPSSGLPILVHYGDMAFTMMFSIMGPGFPDPNVPLKPLTRQ